MAFEDSMPPMVATMDRDLSGFSTGSEVLPAGPSANMPILMQTSREITAKRVAVPRHIPQILKEIREMAAAFGDTYVYSWEAKDRQKGGKSTIKGPTIKCAMMLMQAFRNCSVDMDIQETPTHWIFKAWFMDYESGTSLSRLFSQRKNQSTGMKDADRQMDIVFQIGQSKAARNVVVNALSSFTSYAMEEAEKGLLSRFQSPEAIDRAWTWMEAVMAEHHIELKRVEAVIGRKRKDFTIPNLAKAYMMLRGVAEGMAAADDQFPTAETADEMLDEQEAENKALKRREGRAKKDTGPKAGDQQEESKPDETEQKPKPKPAEASVETFDPAEVERIKGEYFDADNFEEIQGIRGGVAALGYTSAPGVSKAYDDAIARVKRANAAKAAKAAETKPADNSGGGVITGQDDVTEQESELVGEPASDGFDEAAALERIEEIFSDLNVEQEIRETQDGLMPTIKKLSESGMKRAALAYETAMHRAKAKAAEVAPGPSESDMLFGADN